MEKSFSDIVNDYEQAVFRADHECWFEATIAVIDGVMKSCDPLGLAERGTKDSAREHWYTRLASALTVYIADTRTKLDFEQLSKVCRRKQAITYIFQASGFRNMAHLLPLIGSELEGRQLTLKLDRVPVIFAFIGIEDIPPELLQVALRQPPKLLLILMLGWLNQRAVLSEQGERNRSTLLNSGHLVEEVQISDVDVGLIVNAWMYCTYSGDENKHAIKKSFNLLMANLVTSALGELPQPQVPSREKPRLVIIHERFITPHAMYRCYAPMIRGLREYFELIAIAQDDQIDDGSDGLFDEIIKIPKDDKNLSAIVKTVQDQAPDLIYYPSLGMSHWTVLLAQIRLAPIQFMTHGHPATSMSPQIDYVYLNEIRGDHNTLHSEKVLMGPSLLNFDAHNELPKDLPSLVAPSDREVRVAVNSKVMKLSSRLMDVCARLHENAAQKVRFSFFPGERNLYFDGLTAAIRSRLPSADVIPYVSYEQFLNEICKCDMALSAFPFGNTNSTVDTSLLGLPTVARRGTDSAGQTDSLVIATAGLPTWLICDSDEDYYSTALKMINDSDTRAAALGGLDRAQIRKNLFENTEDRKDTYFARMIWELHLRHHQLQQTDQRIFHFSEWLEV